jgi:hypothetical protein
MVVVLAWVFSLLLAPGPSNFLLPLPGGQHYELYAEYGTPNGNCFAGIGGAAVTGDPICAHSEASRYSLHFRAAAKTPVLAAADGRVIKIGHDPVIGFFVKVKHRGHYTSWYGSLEEGSISVVVGQEVRQGDALGLVGGTATDQSLVGPMLHFEVRYNNQASNKKLSRLLVEQLPFSDFRIGTPHAPRVYASSNRTYF